MSEPEDLNLNKMNLNESIDHLLNIEKSKLIDHLEISASRESKFKLKEDFITENSYGNEIINIKAILENRFDFIKDIQNNISYYNEFVNLSKNFTKDNKKIEYNGDSIDLTNFELFNEILDNKPIPISTKEGLYANNIAPKSKRSHSIIKLLILDHPIEFHIPSYAKDINDIPSLIKYFKSVPVPIITPSSQRPNGYLNKEKVINFACDEILVVRPIDLENYKKWKNHFIMVLPDPQAGVGYARYWCQQLANFLELEMCWMIDDLVKSLSCYPKRKVLWDNQKDLMEKTMKDHKHKIGLLSIKSENDYDNRAMKPKIHLCQVFVLMNVKLLKKNNIEYNRSLCHKEDVLLTIDTLNKGLLAIMYRNLYFTDKKHRETGAQSPISGNKASYSTKTIQNNPKSKK